MSDLTDCPLEVATFAPGIPPEISAMPPFQVVPVCSDTEYFSDPTPASSWSGAWTAFTGGLYSTSGTESVIDRIWQFVAYIATGDGGDGSTFVIGSRRYHGFPGIISSHYYTPWRWRYYSATGYLKIWWDEVIYIDGGEHSRVSKEFEDTAAAGPTDTGIMETGGYEGWLESELFEDDFSDVSGFSAWTDPFPAEGINLRKKIENIRFSCLPGYEPGDGDTNGFLQAL